MQSRKTAFCGVLAALSVVLMLLGSALQVGTYAAPMLAAFLQIPVLEEYGPRSALLLYTASAVLALLLVLGNVSFALYDRALAVLTRCYRTVWRKKLKFFH